MRRLAWSFVVFLSCSPPPPPGLDGGAECKGVALRTLEQVYPSYFDGAAPTGCVVGCHGVGLGGLRFSTAAEFQQSTSGKPAASGEGTLVTPFSPSRSWLFQKLKPSAPSPMPQGSTLLTAAQLADVEGWICAGAPGPPGAGGGGGTSLLKVTSFSPTSGLVGAVVTIAGEGFNPTRAQNTISFNGTPTNVLSASSTALKANVPSGASTGKISVTVGSQTATSTVSFMVTAGNPIPLIAALSPCGRVAGAASFSLTVSGANFLAGSTISFNGQNLAVTNATATQLTATVPATAVATAPAGNAAQVIVANPPPAGGASVPAVFGVASAVSTLAATVQPIFNADCATAGCHSAAARAGALELTAASARTNLIDAPSSVCGERLRVAGCDPTRAASALIDKILATPMNPACAGTPMPKGAPLSATEKQRIIDWVAQGAP